MKGSPCLLPIAGVLFLSIMWSGCGGAQHIATTIPPGTNVANVGNGTVPAGPSATPNYRKR